MKSIRRQLTLTILIGFGVLLVSSSAGIYFFTRVALLNEFDSSLKAKADSIISLTEPRGSGIHIEAGDVFSSNFSDDSNPQFYEVWQADGTARARSESLHHADLPKRFGSLSRPEYWNFILPNGHWGRAIGLKFTPRTEEDDALTSNTPVEAIVVVASDRSSLDRTLTILLTVLGLAALITIAITVPLVSLSLRRGHAPLGLLARQTAHINADSLQNRFAVDSMPDELQPITICLNDLLGRLEKSFERERRFSANLAHELRTPLAELRSHAEVELEFAEGAESEKHQETLDIALQMEALVNRLLEMARAENGKLSPVVEPVLIAPLIEEIWRPLDAKAKKKQLTMKANIAPDVSIQTDRTLIRSILANLLSNAVEYAPGKGQIEIEWQKSLGELTVSNTVDDLSREDVPHLFERLWRKDTSRTGNEHFGLGLALSREFAELLNLKLSARFSDEKTLVLSLTVPKSQLVS